MATVGLNIRTYVNETCLTALLWNALMSKHGGPEETTRAIADRPLTLGLVRDLVRTELAMHGTESVCCGPAEDYYAPCVETLLCDLVKRAFRI